MGKVTSIQWSDSSLNLAIGCTGCELWKPGVRKCYAGRQTEGRKGFKGWPAGGFEVPELFLERLDPALKWKDLSGTDRIEKPWLDGLPRIVFLNDMGDTFTKGLPLDWLAPLLPAMAQSPHQFLLLTKRPSLAVKFSESHPFPENFWLGTTVTANNVLARVDHLRNVRGGMFRFLSVEPIWERIKQDAYAGMDWVIFGGESGEEPAMTSLDAIAYGIEEARAHGAKVFVKQLGGAPYFEEDACDPTGNVSITRQIPFPVKDEHGGDWNHWPQPLRVREMPALQPMTLF